MIGFKKVASAAMLTTTVSLTACVDDGRGTAEEGITADTFDFVAMFVNYADNIIIPNYQAVAERADTLSATTGPLANYCAAIGTANETTALTAAETAWSDLQAAIQQSESHVIGPAADNGESLRNRLNSYQAGELSTCGIDQSVVLASQDPNFDVAGRTVNQRSIAAVEYLLFNQDLTHTCPSQITETATWDARSADERKTLRCEYAVKVSEDIATTADTLVNAWSTDSGNYRSTFVNPNNIAASLEALSDAMFYMDVEVKDSKLGIPTGISNSCSGFSCAEDVESPYSQTSLQNIRNNLVAFEQMLTGGNGLGFDDIIVQADVSELNDRFVTNISDAIGNIDSQTTSLFTQASNIVDAQDEADCNNAFANPSTPTSIPACNLYGFIKLITDDLKVGFVAAVDVDLPDRAQSDND